MEHIHIARPNPLTSDKVEATSKLATILLADTECRPFVVAQFALNEEDIDACS
jgi:hypothetical protein